MATETKSHPVFARVYTWLSPREDDAGQDENRRELLAGAQGRALELGAGNGLNLRHYPPTVERVVAVEPEPYLRAKAQEAAAGAPVVIRVVDGVADALPAGDGEFDAGVASLVLCSVPDQAVALAELRRTIKAGGELRFYEHVIATHPRRARIFRLVDRSGVWRHIAAGCHVARDTGASIEAAGFEVERMRRLSFNGLPHILGVARA